MGRPSRVWFRKSRGWWMVELDGKQVKLCQGRANRAQAEGIYHTLMAERLANPPVDQGNPTVASLIDAFLDFSLHRDAPSTHYERAIYLRDFVDVHGIRLVRECLPYHLTSCVDAHPTWRSDWTKSYAVRVVKRAFNWGVDQGLLAKNPFARSDIGPEPHGAP